MTDPHIIRQDTPHEVVVGDGSQVASSRSMDPQGPQVRKVLASDADAQAAELARPPGIPPSIARSPDADPSVVFERQSSKPPEQTVDVPDAIGTEAAESIVFDRSIQDAEAAQAVPQAASGQAQDGPVFERSLQDSGAAQAEPLPAPAPAGSGPVLDRSLQDRHVPLPEGATPGQGGPGPVLERASHDRFVPAPAGVPLSQNFQQAPAEGSLPPASPVAVAPPAAPVAPAAPKLPPVATAQAQAQLQDTAKEIQDKVEETLGAADPTWVEMDFPARVIRLKIENDKVRSKLERLEAMTLRV